MTKSLLSISYPMISTEDFDWIQGVRKQHDELYWKVVDPHFTLVFPILSFEEKTLIHHIEQKVKDIKAFEFVLRCAVISNDSFSDFMHVFLVPDEGYSRIVKLHDCLYTGILEDELRLDIPFVPHIGIGNSRNVKACKRLVDDLNKKPFEVKGIVENLDVIWYEGNQVGTIKKISLL